MSVLPTIALRFSQMRDAAVQAGLIEVRDWELRLGNPSAGRRYAIALPAVSAGSVVCQKEISLGLKAQEAANSIDLLLAVFQELKDAE